MPVRSDACSTVMAEILPSASISSNVFSSKSRVSETGTLRNSIWRVSVSAKYRIFMAQTPGQRTRCELSHHLIAESHAAPCHRLRELEPNVESDRRPECARAWAPEGPARSVRLGLRYGSIGTHPHRPEVRCGLHRPTLPERPETSNTSALRLHEAAVPARGRFYVATDCRDRAQSLVTSYLESRTRDS